MIVSRYIIPVDKKDDYKDKSCIYYTKDLYKDTDKFTSFIGSLPSLNSRECQFLYFESDNLENTNTILHSLYLLSFQNFHTFVKFKNEKNDYLEGYAAKLYAELNPVFCILPWNHIQYKPSGQSKLCCRYDIVHEYELYKSNSNSKVVKLFQQREKKLTIQKSSIKDTFHSEYWNTARHSITLNEEIPGCHKCYKEEKNSEIIPMSMRLGMNIVYNQGYLHKKVNSSFPKIEFLEIGFGNYCNMACLTCNSNLSTTWYEDEIKINEIVDDSLKREVFPKLENLQFDLDPETLKTLKTIKFTGGEPMINPEFVKFIDLICNEGYPENISLEIYTNCSYIPSHKLINNLARFKEVQLNLSIDAYGVKNDYIRYGSKWTSDLKHSVSKSIDFYLNFSKIHSNIHVILSATLSVLNILEMPHLIESWMDRYINSGNKIIAFRKTLLPSEHEGFFKIQPAFDPSYLNPNILPNHYYNDVIDWINDYRSNFLNKYPNLEGIPQCINFSLSKLSNIINKSKGNIDLSKKFVNYIQSIDKIRNQSITESLPDIEEKISNFIQNNS